MMLMLSFEQKERKRACQCVSTLHIRVLCAHFAAFFYSCACVQVASSWSLFQVLPSNQHVPEVQDLR